MEKRKYGMLFNVVLLVVACGIIGFITWRFLPEIILLIKDPNHFKKYIDSFGALGIFIFISFQIIQVVIAAIPGELIQIAGGYIYGTFLGTVYSILGISVGTVFAFYIARGLGYRLLKNFISDNGLEKYNAILNNPRAEIIAFLLFLIPGLPKDLLVYAAGLTPIKPIRFLVICMIARIPAILASSFVGANMQEKDYRSVIIVSIIACVLFVVGFLYREKITEWVGHGPMEKLFGKKGDN